MAKKDDKKNGVVYKKRKIGAGFSKTKKPIARKVVKKMTKTKTKKPKK
jgi:hypothetical protein|tara:strand:- start:98 stop:241 length:144 start_codon:yes stop_codon:yes gene_type:complete